MLESEPTVAHAAKASETLSFILDHRRHGDPSHKDKTTTSPSPAVLREIL
jgi:hypothetical protein